MAQQRRRPQAPNSIPVAAPPADEDGFAEIVPVDAPDQSAVIPTDIGVVETKEQPQPETRHMVAVPKGIILKEGQPLEIDGMDAGLFVIVKQDVYREVYPRGTKRPSYFLLYSRGDKIQKSTLVRK